MDPRQVTVKKQLLRPFVIGHGFVASLYVFMPRNLLLLVQMGWNGLKWKVSSVKLERIKMYNGKMFCPFTVISLFKAIMLIESPDVNYRLFEQIVIRVFISLL